MSGVVVLLTNLSQYLKRNVFDDKLTYDEVIDKFDIDVEDNFNFTTIEEMIDYFPKSSFRDY